jgi:NDP-sugar pyrophosphorylase family protein
MITVVIHAGGKGTRLRESYSGPKALAPVDGLPLLWYHLQPYVKSNLDFNYVFTLMHDNKLVQNYLDGLADNYGLKVSSIVEPRPLGRAGSIRLGIEEQVIDPDIPCIMSHPDDLIPVNINDLMSYAESVESTSKTLFLVMAKKTPNPFGIGVTSDNQDVVELEYFLEKPELPLIPNHYANTGMSLYLPDALKEFMKAPLDKKTHAEDEIIPRLVQDRKVAVFLIEHWISVNYNSDYEAVTKMGKEKILEYLHSRAFV